MDGQKYGQLDFDGKSKAEIAIERLRQFEPPEGYYLAYSGGRCSQVVKHLAERSGVQYDAHYHYPTVDPPEVIRHIRAAGDVMMERAQASMWTLIQTNGMPTRLHRWCCRALKERGGSGRVVVTGIRQAESNSRRHRQMVEACYTDRTKRFVNPIVDWSHTDVKQYVEDYQIDVCSLYAEGFKRIGCVLCPMNRATDLHIARWPKIAAAWRRAADRYWAKGTKGVRRFATSEAFWNWWIDRNASAPDDSQPMMFD